jgi:hypothetical protein
MEIGPKGRVLWPLQLIATPELPLNDTVSPMICVQLALVAAPPE